MPLDYEAHVKLEAETIKYVDIKSRNRSSTNRPPTMAERRGMQKKCIKEHVKDWKHRLISFKFVVRPLLKQGETSVFKPLKTRGIFCDGFTLPTHPFKSLNEAQSFLANYGVDVIMPIKGSKDGQLWTKPT